MTVYSDPDLTPAENALCRILDDWIFQPYNKGHWVLGGKYNGLIDTARKIIKAYPDCDFAK